MYSLEDVMKHIKGFKTIWKCRVISGSINLDINNIPADDINFKRIIPQSGDISGISIKSNSNSPGFSFYAKDINTDKIEIEEDQISIYLKLGGQILFFCSSPK
ncbi:hypothetical protein [Fontibacillus phaseoli]|uniref:hypothetical protein n=1 Tax=Fontibacillus phaseoli TaxID=1416533 RepID=UPI000DF263C2|nr:hypothetical protein [Fontibacillus phaseoli]